MSDIMGPWLRFPVPECDLVTSVTPGQGAEQPPSPALEKRHLGWPVSRGGNHLAYLLAWLLQEEFLN